MGKRDSIIYSTFWVASSHGASSSFRLFNKMLIKIDLNTGPWTVNDDVWMRTTFVFKPNWAGW